MIIEAATHALRRHFASTFVDQRKFEMTQYTESQTRREVVERTQCLSDQPMS